MKVGLQLYTVRDAFRADPRGTLEKMAEIGYHYAELFNHNADREIACFGFSAAEIGKLSEETGVSARRR